MIRLQALRSGLCEIQTIMDNETLRYIEWIRANLGRARGKTQIGLARHLGIAHPQITMLMQGKRRLKVDEIPRIAEYLEVEPPTPDEISAADEFVNLFDGASEEARAAALTTLRLGQQKHEE